MKTIKGNLVLTKDTFFYESINVKGDITCKGDIWNLNVNGDIDSIDIHARNIDAHNITARDIHANDIHANDIHAGDIHALDIYAYNVDARDIHANDIHAGDIHAFDIIAHNICAGDIICIKRIKKHKESKTMAYNIVTDRFDREYKEQMPEAKV